MNLFGVRFGKTTVTFSGGSGTSPTLTLVYARIGGFAIVKLPQISLTTVGTAVRLTSTSLPPDVRPQTEQICIAPEVVNGGGLDTVAGKFYIEPTGEILLYRGSGAVFNAASGAGTSMGTTLVFSVV